MSKTELELQLANIESHFNRNNIKEVWQMIIMKQFGKLPKFLDGQIKEEFHKAFKKLGQDMNEIIKTIDANSKKTWNKIKDSFKGFMESLKPVADKIKQFAQDLWESVVKTCHIVVKYCTKKAKEFSRSIQEGYKNVTTLAKKSAKDTKEMFEKVEQKGKTWVQKIEASAKEVAKEVKR